MEANHLFLYKAVMAKCWAGKEMQDRSWIFAEYMRTRVFSVLPTVSRRREEWVGHGWDLNGWRKQLAKSEPTVHLAQGSHALLLMQSRSIQMA